MKRPDRLRYSFLFLFIIVATWTGAGLAVTANRYKATAKAITKVPETPAVHIRGGFIQYWGLLDKKTWTDVLDSMYQAGMRVIVLQYLQNHAPGTDANGNAGLIDYNFFPPNPNDFDPTKLILEYADAKKDMQVYIGLRQHAEFASRWNEATFLNDPKDGEARKNIDLANELWRRYGKGKNGKPYKSFAGWYLPNEMWNQNYSDIEIVQLRQFFRTISEHCKKISNGKLIAVSPFFNPIDVPTPYLSAKDFAERYGEFLESEDKTQRAGVDLVMLQDGVGARELNEQNLEGMIKPYFAEFRSMCNQKKVNLWANVESYEVRSGIRVPTNISRLKAQIKVFNDAPQLADQLITFDFFHYMNPCGHVHSEPEYQRAENELYWSYIQTYMSNPTKLKKPCPPRGTNLR
ncbi:MAG: DUF4434 domain-containing protein [Pyrinomonadaceae bacterium]